MINAFMTFAALNAHVPSIFSWIIYGQEKFIISFNVYCLLGESTSKLFGFSPQSFERRWEFADHLEVRLGQSWIICSVPSTFPGLAHERPHPKGNWSDGKSFEMKNYRRLDAFATLRRRILLIKRNFCKMKRFSRPIQRNSWVAGPGELEINLRSAFIWSFFPSRTIITFFIEA